MKNCAVLVSLLFGACAVAAPIDPRAMVYKTEVVVETVVVYTTVYDDQPVAQATPTAGGYFYEHPKHKPSSAAAVVPTPSSSSSSSSSQAPAYTPPVVAPKPSSTYVAPVVSQVSTPTPQAPTPTPAPVETPKPASSAAYVAPVSSAAPAPVSSAAPAPVSSAAPAPVYSAAPAPGGATGGTFSNVDMTVYDVGKTPNQSLACGVAYTSSDTDYVAAVAPGVWGTSTYDVMTGASTNPNCGKMARVNYGGKSVDVKIVDFCAGCPAGAKDIDLSWAAWNDITDNHALDRLKVSWSFI